MKQLYKAVMMTVLSLLGFVPGLKAADYHVSFEFSGSGADQYITSVSAPYATGEFVDFAKGFDVPEATYIAMYVDSENPNMSVTANGEKLAFSQWTKCYSVVVRTDIVIEVKALVAPTIDVVCNDIEGVDVGYWKSFGDYGKYAYPLDLKVNGLNQFTMESAAIVELYVRAKDGYTVSVKADGVEVTDTEYIPINDGMTLDITVTDNESSVTELTAGGKSVEVYDMLGRRVSDLNSLASGIYVVDGKKVRVSR